MVTTEAIKQLRDETGVSVMQCKRALEEADGDAQKALVILKKHAVAASEKKADRKLGAGAVQAYIHANHEVGTLVELSSETDFVSKNEAFVALAREIAMHIAAASPTVIRREEVDEATRKNVEAVYEKEAENKPDAVKAKVIAGKLDAYFKEVVLLEQPFIKDPEKTIKDLIDEAIQKFGEKIEITRFVRFSTRG
jgi:elongation factor Ts